MLLRRRRVLCYIFISSLLTCLLMYYVFCVYTFKSDRLSILASFYFLKKDSANTFTNTSSETAGDTSQCPQTMEVSPHFIEVKRGTLLYSAWFDDRKGQSCIQVLLMTSHRKQPPLLSCRFQNGSNCNISARAVTPYYEISSPYSNYGLFVACCVLPKDLVSIPNSVDISLNLSSKAANKSIVLPVGNTRKDKSSKRDYGICIAPLFGNIRVGELIEFLELSQLLGASYFTFYDYEISDDIRRVLNYYENKGLAQVLSWKLPSYITDEDVNYYGQVFAMQDCLFRSINRLNFVAFNDLDEFIVPLHYDSMPSLLHSIHDKNYCGHCFQSFRFPRVENANQTSLVSLLFSQKVLRRFLKPDRSHTKCVGDPQRVFEHGVHLIVQPLEGYKTNDVSWNEARVFHYRKCPAPCDMTADMEVDTTVQKYGERLTKNVIASMANSKVLLQSKSAISKSRKGGK